MPRIIKPLSKGDFTSATISVDSQGRVISASSGSGASNFEYVLWTNSGSSNVSAPSNVTKVQAFLWGGGGGGGGGDNNPPESGQSGGAGGFGYFTGSLSGPATVPYSVGGGGSGGGHPNGTGNSGNATNFHNFTANGGGGGSRNSGGSSG